LQKYKIENGKLVELWTCDDIKGGYSLCTDSDGLIYVSTGFLKKIYVVSSQGAANIKIVTKELKYRERNRIFNSLEHRFSHFK